jgi:3-hydroxybutyryl-CoA dehydratase
MAVGEKGQFTRTLTDGEVALFIGATWDVNPLHTDDSFAAQTRFGRRIVPGLLTASLFTHMGGLWNFLATEMGFEFLGPVYVGDTVTAVIEITELSDKGWLRLAGTITNSNGEVVLRAQIKGYPGEFEE